MTRNQRKIAFVAGVVGLMVLTAGASAYVATEISRDDAPAKVQEKGTSEDISWNEPRQEPAPQQQAASSCDDANVVGAAIGAVAGGVAGNQIGDGRGQDLATVGGAIGGGFLGQQYIPTRNVLCP